MNDKIVSPVIKKLLKEKEVTTARVTAIVEKSLKDQCDYICNATGIKVEEYLGELLAKSEINKVYKALVKESDMVEKPVEDISNTTNMGGHNEPS